MPISSSTRRSVVELRNDWVEYRLGELFTERVETNREDLPLLSITNDRGVVRRDELDRKDSSNPDKRLYLRIAIGDIGYNTMRMWQGVSARSSLEGIVSPAYTICTPNNRIEGGFAAVLFKFPPMVHLFRRYSQGLVDDTLSLKFAHFAEIRVRIPTIEEQQRIAAFALSLAREASLAQDLANALDRRRRGLLDGVLSGDLRLAPTP